MSSPGVGLVAGGALVLVGVYVGALFRTGKPKVEALESRPELSGVPADSIRCT